MTTGSEHAAAEQLLSQQVEQRTSERFRLIHELASKTIDQATERGLERTDLALLGGLLLAQANLNYVRDQLADLTLKVNYLCHKLEVSNEELYAYIEFMPDEESDADA